MAAKKLDVTLEELLEAGAHFGHQSRRWNSKMQPYLHGVKEGVHIFDLVKTREALLEVLDVLKEAAAQKKVILFVGTKKQAREKIKEIATATGSPYVNERWLGGTLTNFDQILTSVRKLEDMKQKMSEGFYKDYTKKERLLIERDIAKMEKSFGGIAQMKTLPDMMVIVDTHKEEGAAKEARSLGIETIGIVDSNADPTKVDMLVPMNDDGERAVKLALDLMGKAVLAGQTRKTVKKKKQNGKN